MWVLMNLGPRQEQPVLLSTKPLLQLLTFSSFKCQRYVRNLGGFFVRLFLPEFMSQWHPKSRKEVKSQTWPCSFQALLIRLATSGEGKVSCCQPLPLDVIGLAFSFCHLFPAQP